MEIANDNTIAEHAMAFIWYAGLNAQSSISVSHCTGYIFVRTQIPVHSDWHNRCIDRWQCVVVDYVW